VKNYVSVSAYFSLPVILYIHLIWLPFSVMILQINYFALLQLTVPSTVDVPAGMMHVV